MMKNEKEAGGGPLDHGWDNPGYKYLTRLTNEILPSPGNFEEPIDKKDNNGPATRYLTFYFCPETVYLP